VNSTQLLTVAIMMIRAVLLFCLLNSLQLCSTGQSDSLDKGDDRGIGIVVHAYSRVIIMYYKNGKLSATIELRAFANILQPSLTLL